VLCKSKLEYPQVKGTLWHGGTVKPLDPTVVVRAPKISFRVTADELETLDRIAQQRGMTRGALVREGLALLSEKPIKT
jgi:hypothetical protein